jgi:7-cyano-7-deazaguanine synthase in queuosine biosynthesis
MLSNKEIILFSGGVDSAVLLKWLLINTNTDYLVIFLNHNNNNIQEKKADKLINIFKIKFRDFEYIKLKFNIKTDKRFDLMVDQVLLFLTGILCYERNIEKVWMGHFSYCSFHHYQFNNKIDNFWYNGELIPFIQSFSKASDSLLKPKLMLPSQVYEGKHLDSFINKKTAYDYLDKEIQEKTRSCYTKNKNFCGTCYKCNQYKLFGIK